MKCLSTNALRAIAVCVAITAGVLLPESAAVADTQAIKQLSADWWHWALSFPAAASPLTDTTGEHCMLGQPGSPWFLSGTWIWSGGTRTCSVPKDTPLFVPVYSYVNFDSPNVCGLGPDHQTVDQLRADAATDVDGARNVSVFLDGQSIGPVPRVQSEVFAVTLPADNVFDPSCFPLDVPAGIYSPGIADGYYALIDPLPVGTHTLRIYSEYVGIGPVTDLTYILTVASTSFSGPTATGTGIATASFTCTDAADCTYTHAAWVAQPGAAGAPPRLAAIAGVNFPHGLFDFEIAGSNPGFTANFTLTFPQPLPAGTVYYKFGPTAVNQIPHWYRIPATVSGNTMTFSITDGGLGDDDLTANGTIVDQGGPGQPPAGATFTVTNTNDSGPGSLRNAIALANNAGGSNTINFAVSGTIVLTSGPIRIGGALSIDGPGADNLAIDGNASSQIFVIVESNPPACPALTGPNDSLVSISGLTLRNAIVNLGNLPGGAILSLKSLALNSVDIRNSTAIAGGGVGFIVQYPGQSLTIANSRFINNVAKPTAAGNNPGSVGGALGAGDRCNGARIPATMTIDGSVFSGNQVKPGGNVSGNGGEGGAIFLDFSGPVVIQDTRIVDNHADSSPLSADFGYNGGGIAGYAKSLTIRRSEIAQNSADFLGGIAAVNLDANLQGAGSAMQLTIVDSTVSGNVANQTGGGMGMGGNVSVMVANSTVAGNVANWLNQDGPRISGIGLFTNATDPPSQSNATPPTLQLVSSIVAGGQISSPDIGTDGVPVPFSVNASNSLVQFPDPNVVLAGSGNLVGVDPLVAPLAFNGGQTRTQALSGGSPAINAIRNPLNLTTGLSVSPAIDAGGNPLNLTTDQRGAGYPRTSSNSATDIGSFQSGAGSANANQWVQKAYESYYGRPGDPPGLAYWARRMDVEGGSLASIIASFGYSDEFDRRYGNLTNSELLDSLYQQMLGRAPDALGKQYYLDQLSAGHTTLQTITLDLLGGATGLDALTVANRLEVADYYSNMVAAGCAYGGEQTGVDTLASVTPEAASVVAAKAAINKRCGA